MSAAGGDLQAEFAAAMGQLLGPDFPSDIGLAVSGGGDSMAMLTLAHNWTRDFGVRLWVVSIDHGLRDESAAETALVARECAVLRHSHAILRWRGWAGQGNLQDAARDARLRLIDHWRGQLRHVLMAHTADDQAETFLMRLARGSGVDGLAAMAPKRFVAQRDDADESRQPGWPPEAATPDDGFWVIRPLLNMRRDDLRDYLHVLKGVWVEDPSNSDPQYERVRMRQALTQLEALGLDVDTLIGTAARMARAKEALAQRAAEFAKSAVRQMFGDLLIDRDMLRDVDEETRLRVLAGALQYVAAAPYRPRAQALEVMAERVMAGGTATLHGCLIRPQKAQLRICREFGAIDAAKTQVGKIWDRRVLITGDEIARFQVRALGENGAAQLPVRPEGVPFQSLIAQAAVFDGDTLMAFEPAAFGPSYCVNYFFGQRSFESFLVSH